MRIVIDSNIVISAMISPNGLIANIIFNKTKSFNLLAPNYLLYEIKSKEAKIKKLTGYSSDDFFELLQIITKRIKFIDEPLITEENIKNAYRLTHDVDPKDTYYVALTIQSEAMLWTGDKKLMQGLSKKGFDQIIDTKRLLENI